jgi:GT2 family glycosyltransferase
MSQLPFISIITVNYKKPEVTNQLLSSLREITYSNFEVIIVDNDSGDEEAAKLNFSDPKVRLIRSFLNRGLAGGNNLGIQCARGDYFLFLNNDTEVHRNFLEPLVKVFQEHPDAGAVSPKIKYYSRPRIIQYAGYSKMNPVTLRMHALGSRKEDTGQYDQLTTTWCAHGCAMMVPRAVVRKAGMWPEEYFLYYEEHDWSTSIKEAGYNIYFQPESIVFHKESLSADKSSPRKVYYQNRNRILFMKKNLDYLHKVLATIYLLLVAVPRNTFRFLFSKKKGYLKAYFKAIKWNLRPGVHHLNAKDKLTLQASLPWKQLLPR